MRQRSVALIAVLLCVLAGCGVPGSSEPEMLAPAPPLNRAQPERPRQPSTPADATSETELVEFYLHAAAGANSTGGDRSNAAALAQQRVRAFLTEQESREWQAGNNLTVYRSRIESPVASPDGVSTVRVTMQPVGVLNDFGVLEQQFGPEEQHQFRVVRVGDQWRLDGVPPNMRLSVEGLRLWYITQPIYFWDNYGDGPTLVPDLRYLPVEIAEGKRPAEVIRWLSAGPTQWLQPVLQTLPVEIELKDNPAIERDPDRLVVNLTAKARTLEPIQLTRLAVQVRWSLRDYGGLALLIDGQPTNIGTDDFLGQNLAYRPDTSPIPDRFGVVDGRVRSTADGEVPRVFSGDVNTAVVTAALTQDRRNAALVRMVDGRPRLYLGVEGTGSDPQRPVWAEVSLVGQVFSRPTWLFRPDRRALVAVDGNLYTVRSPVGTGAAGAAIRVTLPEALRGKVTDVSVAPDGRRIALIADGQVIVAPLLFGDTFTVGSTYRVVRTGLAAQRAVGWSSETKLLVGGRPVDGTSSLIEVPVTGTELVSRPADGLQRVLEVTRLVVSPVSASTPDALSFVMFEASDLIVYRVFGRSIDPLTLGTPSASPPGTPTGSQAIRAPFIPE